jgi:hypothetical protein
MVLVDSSVWIESLRRRGRIEAKLALEALLDAYEAQYCAPVRLEVLGGARAADRRRLGLYFSVIPFRRCDPADWERSIALAWRLRDAGLSVPWMNVVIAAIALYDNSRLYALDAHFERIAEITGLRIYRPGYAGMYQPEEPND